MNHPGQRELHASRRDGSSDLSAVVVDGKSSDSSRRDRSSDLSAALPKRRSSPRAAGFDYVGGYRYHVTFVTHDRNPNFAERKWAENTVAVPCDVAIATQFELDAYCVMPDHVHVLIRGESAECSLHTFAHRSKLKIGYAFKQATGSPIWQDSYHDHVLRPDEPSLPHAEYILANPVEAGLVASEEEWPYSGPPWWFDESADRSKDLSLRGHVEPSDGGAGVWHG